MAILEAVFDVFASVSSWFVTALSDVTSIFYVAETGLTFIGVLAVTGLGISIVTWLVATVRSYLQLRA